MEDAGRGLLRAPRRRRHRLARARCSATSTEGAGGRRARPRSARACRCWSTRPTGPTCSRASAAISISRRFQHPRRHPPRAPAMRWTPSRSTSPRIEGRSGAYRDLISLVETQLAQRCRRHALPAAESSRGRLSRRVKSFPVMPRITLMPDERAQRWLAAGESPPATAPACCTPSRVLARSTTSTCSSPRSPRWASASRTPSDRRLGAAAEQAAARDRDRTARRDQPRHDRQKLLPTRRLARLAEFDDALIDARSPAESTPVARPPPGASTGRA